jgi:beta-xylosidase
MPPSIRSRIQTEKVWVSAILLDARHKISEVKRLRHRENQAGLPQPAVNARRCDSVLPKSVGDQVFKRGEDERAVTQRHAQQLPRVGQPVEQGIRNQFDTIGCVIRMIITAKHVSRAQIDRSGFSGLPLHLTEWSSESPAFIAHTITHCLPSLQSMSYWTFSGVFEELGVARTPIGDGDFTFGMTALRGIPEPSLHAFALLKRLYGKGVRSTGPSLATRDDNGAVAVLLWNLGTSDASSGIPGVTRSQQTAAQQRTLSIKVTGPARPIRLTRIDMDRGSARSAWEAMGKPAYPTTDQLAALREAATMPAAEILKSDGQGRLSIALASDGLALLEIPE